MSDVRDFKLPDLGEGLEDGEIVSWAVEVGEVIELNQTVAEIETAKAVVAVPSPFAGKVVERVGDVGATLEVGSVLVRIDVGVEGGEVGAALADDDAAVGDVSAQTTGGSPAQAATEVTLGAAAEAAPSTAGGARPEAQPKASALAADEEPQPLVGYGQGKAAGRRRRRRGGAPPDGDGQAAAASATTPLAKPPVRKLAKDLGVDLAALAPGSGPEGSITRDDVHAAADGAIAGDVTAGAAATAPAPDAAPAPTLAPAAGAGEKAVPGFRGRVPGEVEPIRGIRKRIVEKVQTSRREIPEALCSRDADLTELWQLRRDLTDAAHADGFDVKITPFAVVLRATILALRRFPTLNARIVDADGNPYTGDGAGEIRLLEHVNLGFAADTDRGLVVPNIKDAHARSTLQLAQELNRLAAAARDGSIGPGDLTGGTFTVNNYGAFGADDGNPIINHPEGAILGIGAMRERPWVVDGELAVRRIGRFTLAFDHRICDGGEAGRFVAYVADLCERPSRILLHS